MKCGTNTTHTVALFTPLICHDAGELHFHVLYKTAQFGAITGLLLFGPVAGLIAGPHTMFDIASTAYSVRIPSTIYHLTLNINFYFTLTITMN